MPRISAYPVATTITGSESVLLNQNNVTKTAPVSLIRSSANTPGWFNVQDYGAVGNGTTDDTSAIQAALTSAVTGRRGGYVYLPTGTYLITSTLTLADPAGGFQNAISIFGEGPTLSKIIWGGGIGSEIPVLDVLGQGYNRLQGFSLSNTQGVGSLVGLWLRGDAGSGGTTGGSSVVSQVSLSGFHYGLVLGDPGNAVSEVLFELLNISSCTTGVYGTNQNALDFTFLMLVMSSNTTGLRMNGAGCVQIYGGSASNNTTDFRFNSGGSALVSGFRSEGNALFALHEAGALNIQGCTVANNASNGVSIQTHDTLAILSSWIDGQVQIAPNCSISLLNNHLGCGGDSGGSLIYAISGSDLTGVTTLAQNNHSVPSINGTFRFANSVAS